MVEMLRRFRPFEPNWKRTAPGKPGAGKREDGDTEAEEDGAMSALDILASTDEPADWGGYREVLVHAAGAVDTAGACALLLNHNPNLIAGRISNFKVADGHLDVSSDIMPDARLQTGPTVRDAVDFGALRGVSIGYDYSPDDTEWDEATHTLTVHRWRLLEVSLTPTPKDQEAQVRSRPEWVPTPPPAASRAAVTKDHPMAAEAAPNTPNPQGKDNAASPTIEAASETGRAAGIKHAREIAAMAREHGLDPDKYMDMSMDKASSQMLRDLAEKNRTTLEQPAVSIAVDAADKARDAAVGAILHGAGLRTGAAVELQKNNEMKGRSILDIARLTAYALGARGVINWSRTDLAWYVLGKREMMGARAQRDAANVAVGSFSSFVTLNAISKSIAIGYEQDTKSVNYQRLVTIERRPDFKSYYIGGLSAGNLQKTAEDVAFPELDKSEGVYNNTVKMWGGTMSLTLQALISDDTSQFDRNLRNAGVLARKTINKRVFQKLLMGTSAAEATSTWTNNTTSGGDYTYTTADLAYAARAKVGKVRAALINKVGLDGNPLGTIPRFMIVGPTHAVEARGLMEVAPGQQTVENPSLEVIESAWLESSLIGNSTSSYYLLADPNEVTGLVVSLLTGMEEPQVMPYDAGAVAAAKWKIFQPFEADLVYETINGTATIAAAQQGTT